MLASFGAEAAAFCFAQRFCCQRQRFSFRAAALILRRLRTGAAVIVSLGSMTRQQSTDLLQACNFGVNRGENLVYSHFLKYIETTSGL